MQIKKTEICNLLLDDTNQFDDIIDKLLLERQYSFLLYDKSIIQIEYYVVNGDIKTARLLFIKKHNRHYTISEIEKLDSEESNWYEEDKGIPTIIRFDCSKKDYESCKHPITHLTLSNCDDCRIPVKRIISCSEFVDFIMRNFYNEVLNMPLEKIEDETIDENERKLPHLDWKESV